MGKYISPAFTPGELTRRKRRAKEVKTRARVLAHATKSVSTVKGQLGPNRGGDLIDRDVGQLRAVYGGHARAEGLPDLGGGWAVEGYGRHAEDAGEMRGAAVVADEGRGFVDQLPEGYQIGRLLD